MLHDGVSKCKENFWRRQGLLPNAGQWYTEPWERRPAQTNLHACKKIDVIDIHWTLAEDHS